MNNTVAIAKANKAIQAFCANNFFDVEIEAPVRMEESNIVRAKYVYGTTEYQVVLDVWDGINFVNVAVSARVTRDNGHESMTRIMGRLSMMKSLAKGVNRELEMQGFETSPAYCAA